MSNKRNFQEIATIPTGEKYDTPGGFAAIKNGIKHRKIIIDLDTKKVKPAWLKARISGGRVFEEVKSIVRSNQLSTVCEESMCPNIGECWNNGTATIMVMGSVCTRACKFCAVDTGNPKGSLDSNEPANIALAVKLMKLDYVVITSVDRDDLEDGGAAHYADCVHEIKQLNPKTKVEALTPDFNGVMKDVRKVIMSGLDVFAQNIEVVERLTSEVRDPRAGYGKTLNVLAKAKSINSSVLTKSSLMLGLGETEDEVYSTMRDLRANDVDIVTLGQYLSPSINHLPVKRYVHPNKFEEYREEGLKMGFLEVVSGPLVRSSYRADRVFNQNNVGMHIHTI
ncbi:MAG TPA: lipoyl synthase [Woeseiaceae bacterium]|nr:lipoyl synthase [Woeseiaceae bacterium]|tara:strand:- start:29884 stop:30897 length:1014 start_codon:yes stop_codon:yes gene_type:complete